MTFDGLEVDQRHRSLGTEGLQTAPAELQPGNGSSPQFLPGPDIEAITVDSQPKADVLNTSRNSIFRRRWKLLLLLAIAVIVVIVIAVAVPLGIIHKGGSRYEAVCTRIEIELIIVVTAPTRKPPHPPIPGLSTAPA